jgi:Ca2+-binding RTX toxin-like protein
VTINLATGAASGSHAAGDSFTGFEALLGSAYDDRLTGNNGKNIITGAAGRDILRGGNGADRFDYNTVADSTGAATGRDFILDFDTRSGDVIDLSTIDAIANGGATNDSFQFIGTNAFSARGQVRYLHQNGLTIIEINVSTDPGIEMRIALDGVLNLAGDDFRL